MLRRPERGIKEENLSKTRELRAFTIFNLVDVLDELKRQGFFYSQEWLRTGEEPVWKDILQEMELIPMQGEIS